MFNTKKLISMPIKKYFPIRFKRNLEIAESREIAVNLLNTIEIKYGEPIVVKYYKNSNKEVDIVFAIGISDGIGPEYYKIISIGGLMTVNDVVTELPDVTQLVHGERYIYVDEILQQNYLVILGKDGITREFIPLDEEYTVISLATGKVYFTSRDSVKENSDFYTQNEVDELLEILVEEDLEALRDFIEEVRDTFNKNLIDLEERVDNKIQEQGDKLEEEITELMIEVFPLTINFDTSTKIYEIGTTNNISFTFSVYRKGIDVTNDCTFKINGSSVSVENNTFENITNTTKFTLEAQYKDLMSDTKDLTVNYVNRSYWATVDSNFIVNESNIKSTSEGTLRVKSTLTYDTSLNLQKIYYAYPKSYGKLKQILDSNGFDYIPDYTITELNISNVPYYVYFKITKATINNFRQQFIF